MTTQQKKAETMTNNELYTLKQVIVNVREKGNNKFKLPLILNEKKIDAHIEALEELRRPSDLFKEYEQKRQQLIAEHAEKDDGGNVRIYSKPNGEGNIVQNGYPNIVTDKDGFEEKIKALQEEYKETIDEMVKKEQDFIKTLEEEADIELKTIPFDNFPEMGYDELKVLTSIIEE